jgi:hypothetical protein
MGIFWVVPQLRSVSNIMFLPGIFPFSEDSCALQSVAHQFSAATPSLGFILESSVIDVQ